MRASAIFFLLFWLIFGCQQPSGNSNAGVDGNQPVLPAATDTSLMRPVRPFDRELAETLTAMYYSDLNRDAKYPKYKGLLVSIDTAAITVSEGSAMFRARIDGRLWTTPNGDTVTTPYKDTLSFLAAWDGNKWTAKVADQ